MKFKIEFNKKSKKIKLLTEQLNAAQIVIDNAILKVDIIEDDIKKLIAELNSIRKEPVMETNYYMDNNLKSKYKHFIDYWDGELADKYFCWDLFKISRNETLTNMLFKSIINFDFDDIEKYMKETNWFWSNKKRSPNKYELLITVFSLASGFLNDEYIIDSQIDEKKYSEISSGGFYIKLHYDDNKKPEKITINFKKSDGDY